MVDEDVPFTTHWRMVDGTPTFLHLSWSPITWGEMHCFGEADGPLDTIFSIQSEPFLTQEDLDQTKRWGKIPGQIKQWIVISDNPGKSVRNVIPLVVRGYHVIKLTSLRNRQKDLSKQLTKTRIPGSRMNSFKVDFNPEGRERVMKTKTFCEIISETVEIWKIPTSETARLQKVSLQSPL